LVVRFQAYSDYTYEIEARTPAGYYIETSQRGCFASVSQTKGNEPTGNRYK